MKTPKLVPFLFLNLLLVGGSLSFFFAPIPGRPEFIAFLASVAVATLIIVVQHAAVKKYQKWWQWLLVFYSGMLCYLFALGAAGSYIFAPDEAQGIARTIGGGYLILFIGQIYGIALVPLILGANLLFRRFCPDALAIPQRA